MKVSTDIPPIYYECQKYFGVSWDNGIAIAYDKTVYSAYPLGFSVETHEAVHLRQQKEWGDPASWWQKYLTDKAFRLSQELEAYRAQINYIKENLKDRNEIFRRIDSLCRDLSSSMYGRMVTYSEAKRLLLEPQKESVHPYKCTYCFKPFTRSSQVCIDCRRELAQKPHD